MEIVSLRESPQEVERFTVYFQSRWGERYHPESERSRLYGIEP